MRSPSDSAPRRTLHGSAGTQLLDGPDEDRQRKLLRQLRDLDDDLEAGKLTIEDHLRLREPLEREAAAALLQARQATRDPGRSDRPGGTARAHRTAAAKAGGEPAPTGTSDGGRRRRTTVLVLVAAAATAAVVVLLAKAATPRQAGQTISGTAPGVGAPAAASSAPAPAGPGQQSGSAAPTLSAQQAAAIAKAAAQVKAHPKDSSAHLALASAYSDAGASQLAAVEYLAITRLDPTNAQANTALALLAFDVGKPAQAKKLVDTAVAAHPNYPDGHYVRALIELMGLRQAQPAAADLQSYLALAPFGSHRTAADTLLALATSQASGAPSSQPSAQPVGPTVEQGHK
jgi:hypothetical protein